MSKLQTCIPHTAATGQLDRSRVGAARLLGVWCDDASVRGHACSRSDDTLRSAMFRSRSVTNQPSLAQRSARPRAGGNAGWRISRLSRQRSCTDCVAVAGRGGVAASRRGSSRPSRPGTKHGAPPRSQRASDDPAARIPPQRLAGLRRVHRMAGGRPLRPLLHRDGVN